MKIKNYVFYVSDTRNQNICKNLSNLSAPSRPTVAPNPRSLTQVTQAGVMNFFFWLSAHDSYKLFASE